MARVFVSYRRADGRMAVDWIAERLTTLDAINGVETAFDKERATKSGLEDGVEVPKLFRLPPFAGVKAHELGERVLTIAIQRDAERWGILIISGILTLGSGVAVALAAAADQVDSGSAAYQSFGARPLIALPLMLSAVLVIVHRWGAGKLSDGHEALTADLEVLPPRYRRHATPRLVASALTDQGWGFRFARALPAIIAVIGVLAFELNGQ